MYNKHIIISNIKIKYNKLKLYALVFCFFTNYVDYSTAVQTVENHIRGQEEAIMMIFLIAKIPRKNYLQC